MGEKRIYKKRKFNFLKFVAFFLLLYIFFSVGMYIIKIPIKHIVILGNYNLTDELIIETSKIEKYPSFLQTSTRGIKKRLLKNNLVKNVTIKRKWNYVLEIKIEENKVLFQSRSNDLYYTENNNTIQKNTSINGVPVLINFVPDEIQNKLTSKMSKLSINSISKISEIEYTPTSYDNERFLLYMIDGNEVYINLNKLNKIDKYTEIVKKLDGHKGVLYLDSGNYFEIKD